MGTKSQKISGAVLAIAVVAFGVDRWVIGTGEGEARPTPAASVAASAGSVPTASAPAAPTAAAPHSKAVAATTRPSLASRLTAMSEARRLSVDSVTDAFQPSAVWLALAAPPAAPVKVEPARPATAPAAAKVDHAALFAQRHTLTAVMKDRDGGMAIINGKLYKVGQYVGPFKLTRVGLTDASFWGKGVGAKLKLAGQYPATADAR